MRILGHCHTAPDDRVIQAQSERGLDMRTKTIAMALIVATSIAVFGRITLAQQDKYTLKVPDGLAFSEFEGYDTWEDVAVSETEGSVKAILGNPTMIRAYKEGLPDNGKPFPEGVKIVKIEWTKKKNPVSPYFVEIPVTLKTVSFIEKDSNRFPNTHGWAYAQFAYDTESKTFKPSGTGSECGYACHTTVASRDYIFTAYPPR
jgi:Cytochrome P460